MQKQNKKRKIEVINTSSQEIYQDQINPYIQFENKRIENDQKHNLDNYISINYGEIKKLNTSR